MKMQSMKRKTIAAGVAVSLAAAGAVSPVVPVGVSPVAHAQVTSIADSEITVPQRGSVTIPLGFGGISGYDKPEWVTIEGGSLTARPGADVEAGEYTVTIQADQVHEYTITVTPTPAPIPRQVPAVLNEELRDPSYAITNFNALPEGTIVSWQEGTNTSTVGGHETAVLVTYPNGDTETVVVPLYVIPDQMPQRYGLEQCTAQLGGGLAALIPAMIILSQLGHGLQVPGWEELMLDVQKRLSFYDPQVAKFVKEQGGAIAAGLVGLTALSVAFIPGTCGDQSMWQALVSSLKGNPEALNPEVRATYELNGSSRYEPKATEAEEASETETEAEVEVEVETS